MSAADELNKMIDGVTDFYNAVEEMGGTVPENKNYANMVAAVESIPLGPLEPGDWGVIYYMNGGKEVGLKLQSADDLTALRDQSIPEFTIAGESIPRESIVRYAFGEQCTNIGNGFLSDLPNLEELINTQVIQTLGDLAFGYCPKLNCPIDFSNVTSMGENILQYCNTFDSPITLPESFSGGFGYNFLLGCAAFNQPITLPNGITSIMSSFLSGCTSFNQPITIPGTVTVINGSFLSNCSSFNQPITMPSSVTRILGSFLNGCTSFNQPIELSSELTQIQASFLQGCTAFAQALTIPATVTTVGTNFMRNCDNFTGILDVGNSTPPSDSNSLATTTSNSVPMYRTGVKITGTNAATWKSSLANRTSSPYRKLTVV